MLFRTRYNVLFRQFRLLTAQAGSIPAAIRLIFENCYNLRLDNAFTQYVLSCRILLYQPLTLATFFGDFVLIKALVGFNNANSIPDIRRTTTKVIDADNLE